MQIIIDIDKIEKKGLSVNEYITLLSIYYKTKSIKINYLDRKADYFSLRDKGFIVINGSSVVLTPESIVLIEGRGRDYIQLATSIREIFPKGTKNGKYPWKGTVKAIVEKLKKLDKSYGMSEYSDEEILNITKRYVNRFSFTDMDRGMQIATYFVEKDGDSSLMSWLSMEEQKFESKASMEIKL